MRSGEILNIILDCEECVKEFSSVTVWKLKNGKYAVCTLSDDERYFRIYSIENCAEFAINNAIWLDSIL